MSIIRKLKELKEETKNELQTYFGKLPDCFQEMSWSEYAKAHGLAGIDEYVIQRGKSYLKINGDLFIANTGDSNSLVRITDPNVLPNYFPLQDED
jgi:hypothetical protein